MKFEILTLFPEMIRPVLEQSIIKRAINAGKISCALHNIRDYALDKRGTVDDRPFGGGPGMVMMCQPVFDCIENVLNLENSTPTKLVLLSPQGTLFNQKIARELTNEQRIILLCGHYEGFDERIHEAFDWLELSIGEYVLSGGELAALVVFDAVTRLLPGVLGDDNSVDFESFEFEGLLDFPQYTRPRDFRGMKVPEVLFSGDHEAVANWRLQKSIEKTKIRKPELELNQSALLSKFSQLPYLQRERKNVKFQTFNNKKNKSHKQQNEINKGETDESADSQS